MSSGAPLIATPHAFRGLGLDPAQLANVALARTRRFRLGAAQAAASLDAPPADQRRADTRAAYDRRFSSVAIERPSRDSSSLFSRVDASQAKAGG